MKMLIKYLNTKYKKIKSSLLIFWIPYPFLKAALNLKCNIFCSPRLMFYEIWERNLFLIRKYVVFALNHHIVWLSGQNIEKLYPF